MRHPPTHTQLAYRGLEKNCEAHLMWGGQVVGRRKKTRHPPRDPISPTSWMLRGCH